MVLLQETMCGTFSALYAFSKLFPKWEFCATDANGLSGGLLSAWDPQIVRCRAYRTCVGILLQASFRGLTYPLSIINTYGPYKNRESFWDTALASGFRTSPNLILGGDLNLILNSSEVWGHNPMPDPLSGYFLALFDSLDLRDLASSSTGPTW